MTKHFFNKKSSYLLVLMIAGILMLFLSGYLSEESKEEANSGTPTEFELCEQRCEERLSEILLDLSEIQYASVMVTLDEIPTNKERPRVRGVAIVCVGKETPELRLKIVMLAGSALGITTDKIYVTFS